jgi:PAS domain S-box-containing protein
MKPADDSNSPALSELELLRRRVAELEQREAAIRQRVEQTLYDSEQRYRALFDHAMDAIFVADADTGLLLDANRQAQALIGRSLDDIRTMRQTDLYPSEEFERARHAFERAKNEPGLHLVELHVMHQDGTTIPVEINSGGVIESQGRHLHLGIFRDMRARKQAEYALLRSARMEVASTLAGGVAHRVNNLMTVVLSNAELLREHLGASEVTSLIDAIIRAALQAAELANQMIGFAEGGKYRPAELLLNTIIQNVTALWSRQQDLNQINLHVQLAPDLRPIVADATQISQVLVNLLHNAREAMPIRGGEIFIITMNRVLHTNTTDQDAESQGIAPGSYVCLIVKDTGAGMSPAVLERIFEPFFTTRFQGRGLGLPAVYGIVKNHGGHIRVLSREGEGTSVVIWLPVAAAAPEAPPPPRPAEPAH